MSKIEFVYSDTTRIPTSNYVQNPHVFTQGRNARRKADRELDQLGLYSPSIFGRYGICKCGVTTKVNKICQNCGYRVLSSKKKVQFGYKTVCPILRFGATIEMVFTSEQLRETPFSDRILDIASYRAGVINDELEISVIDTEELTENFENITNTVFGEEAIKLILPDDLYQEWEEKRSKVLTHTVLISHPVTRPYTITANNKVIVPESTKALMKLITVDLRTRSSLEFMEYAQDRIVDILGYIHVNQAATKYYESVYEAFASSTRSVKKSHVISTNSSAIGRYVLVNNPTLDPDQISVPWSFISVNYNVDPDSSIEDVNRFLADKRVLMNRPPTVSNLSMMTFQPVFGPDSVVGVNPAITSGFNADFDGDQVIVLPIRHADTSAISYWEQRRDLVTGGWRNGLLKRQIEFVLGDDAFRAEIGVPEYVKGGDELNAWFNELDNEIHIETLHKINRELHKAPGITLGDFHLNGAGRVISDSPLLAPGQDEKLFNTEFDKAMIDDFRNGVITSKVGISESGYFYKKAVAAGEYYRFLEDCDAEPVKIEVSDIHEFRRRVQNHYNRSGEIATYTGPGSYEVYTVDGCKHTLEANETPFDRNSVKSRGVCRKCFGYIDSEGVRESPYIGVNTGIILTEVISQETLNAINTGAGEMTVLKVLESDFQGTREEVLGFISRSFNNFLAVMGIQDFEERWIQVQFLSTAYQIHLKRKKTPEPIWNVMTKISSMKMSDPLTRWIAQSSIQNFKSMIGEKFEANSIKSWVMLNKR